jgi:hypothetical protein
VIRNRAPAFRCRRDYVQEISHGASSGTHLSASADWRDIANGRPTRIKGRLQPPLRSAAISVRAALITFGHERLSRPLKPLSHAYVHVMITRNAEPIGHISPYPRIDLSPVRPATAKSRDLSAIEKSTRTAEIERIWRLIVQAAEGN